MIHVFPFDHPHELPARDLRALLGGKGAGLAEMTRALGLRIPPGFTIATTAHRLFERSGLAAIGPELTAALARLEESVGRRLGDTEQPLLLSVRSGAVVSMPGMLDTILNLGLNDRTCEGWARVTSDDFAHMCYARLIRMFGEIVMRVPRRVFADGEHAPPPQRVAMWLAAVEREAGERFPQDPREQIERAIEAVFRSWHGERARAYRKREGISDAVGTAVTVQAMVFGNHAGTSGTGVAFTRDPTTGERVAFGDYLPGAQGEDVVAGTHATQPLAALRDAAPALFAELLAAFDRLERHACDACDVEFTIERGVLWILQSRAAKRSGAAAVRMAVEMATDPDFPLTREEALLRVDPEQLRQAIEIARSTSPLAPIAKGLPASPGVATGRACFSSDDALAASDRGEAVILIRNETSPEDVQGMAVAEGILTATGGLASHAAVVARGWGKPAVVGTPGLTIDRQRAVIGGIDVEEGRVLTIDGSSGEIFLGASSVEQEQRSPHVEILLDWAAEIAGVGARDLDPIAQLERAREVLHRGAPGRI